jgi:hypothetical protein
MYKENEPERNINFVSFQFIFVLTNPPPTHPPTHKSTHQQQRHQQRQRKENQQLEQRRKPNCCCHLLQSLSAHTRLPKTLPNRILFATERKEGKREEGEKERRERRRGEGMREEGAFD